MYQNFADLPAAAETDRLSGLRAAMRRANIDAYLVPRSDEFQGEYVPACAERLLWLTGFSGSAGYALVTQTRAVLFVDGRYTVQAAAQVDNDAFEVMQQPDAKMSDWLASALGRIKKPKLGFDPWLMTMQQVEQTTDSLAEHGIGLKSVSRNLIDRLWKDRPDEPSSTVVRHPVKYAGVSAPEKLDRLRETLREGREDAFIITLPDTLSWLFNLRASDVPHNPVVRAFAIVPANGKAKIFADPDRVSADVAKAVAKYVAFKAPTEFPGALRSLKQQGKMVRLAPAHTPHAIERALSKKQISCGSDPCIAWKAIKNPVEIAGSRAAHARDGTAMCRFLAWLDREAPSGALTEIAAAKKLEQFRQDTGHLKEISFDTISGFGPNGAIVHYRVTEATNRPMKTDGLYLVDSGAQYLEGTTDITRTIAIGSATKAQRAAFTRVLLGHIAIATAVFPKGTRGVDLDALARAPLWRAGLDFDHGTGHGVGSYLSVHEGPQGLSRRSMVELEPGMILSNEPGYYEKDAFGIRIENLILVREPSVPAGGNREMLTFETLTLAPIDTRLIETGLLAPAEIAWLNSYHATVRKKLRDSLPRADRSWLDQACAPISL